MDYKLKIFSLVYILTHVFCSIFETLFNQDSVVGPDSYDELHPTHVQPFFRRLAH